jgi:hypothetical protein
MAMLRAEKIKIILCRLLTSICGQYLLNQEVISQPVSSRARHHVRSNYVSLIP